MQVYRSCMWITVWTANNRLCINIHIHTYIYIHTHTCTCTAHGKCRTKRWDYFGVEFLKSMHFSQYAFFMNCLKTPHMWNVSDALSTIIRSGVVESILRKRQHLRITDQMCPLWQLDFHGDSSPGEGSHFWEPTLGSRHPFSTSVTLLNIPATKSSFWVLETSSQSTKILSGRWMGLERF